MKGQGRCWDERACEGACGREGTGRGSLMGGEEAGGCRLSQSRSPVVYGKDVGVHLRKENPDVVLERRFGGQGKRSFIILS